MRLPPRPLFSPGWGLFLIAAFVVVVCVVPAHAQMEKVAEGDYEMSTFPEDDSSPWTRLGYGTAMLLPDEGSLFINDNRVDDRIGYQTLLGAIQAENRVVLKARLKVLSNFDGRGTVMEISRPGLQVALHLYPNRVELVERTATGTWRWLASASADFFQDYHEVTLEKDSSGMPGGEMVRLWLDGTLIAERRPQADSLLEVGRIVIGAMSRPSMGASIWDWVSYDVDGLEKGLPSSGKTIGALKAAFSGAGVSP